MLAKKMAILLSAVAFFIRANDVHHLIAPDLSDEQIIGTSAGYRPYRATGIRIELEKLGEKEDIFLIHNYGYGGAGLSLSWGGAVEAVALMEQATKKVKEKGPIAIIGAGVVGLTVAHTLLDKGFQVHIYAHDFPPHTTSDIAAGIFSPFAVAVAQTPQAKMRFERMKTYSKMKLIQLSRSANPEFAGVHELNVYNFSPDPIIMRNKMVEVEFNTGVRKPAQLEKSILMQGPIYMKDLFEKVQHKGAVLVQRFFEHKDELLTLGQKIIFNCSGLGAKDLVNDQDIKPIRGQLVYLKKQEGIDYYATEKIKGNEVFFAMYPEQDRLVIGGTLEEGEDIHRSPKELSRQILQNARTVLALKK